MPTKHFGPFTGRQLTTIICVVAFTVALPVGAWGVVSGSPVYIADNHTGAHAAVDAQANLQTKVNGGNIVDAVAIPVNQVNAIAENQNATCRPLYQVPDGKAFVLSSVTMSVMIAATTSPTTVYLYASSGCGANTIGQFRFDANANDSFTFPFPSGLPISAGHVLSAVVFGTGSTPQVSFSVNGHFVPVSQCATGCR